MTRLTNKDLITDPNPILRKRLTKVTFPLSEEYLKSLEQMRQYVVDSYNQELVEKYDLTPSVGIAANQIGIDARMAVVYIEDEDGEVYLDLTMINPVILSSSAKQSYIESGEGCLSVPSRPEGYVYRAKTIKVRYFDTSGEQHVIELDDFESIAVQHEIDHLNGILYSDKITFDKREDADQI
ncbi:peptide deformylase [Mollicutes bacterium LVI A0039]|nr:peptide deformylase [Mollicutes bacterium LVI A0039]